MADDNPSSVTNGIPPRPATIRLPVLKLRGHTNNMDTKQGTANFGSNAPPAMPSQDTSTVDSAPVALSSRPNTSLVEATRKNAAVTANASAIKASQAQQASLRKGILDRITKDREARRQARATSPNPPLSTAPSSKLTPDTTSIPTRKQEGYALRIQTPGGLLQRVFPTNSRLAEIISFVERESGSPVGKLETRVPRKVIWEELTDKEHRCEDAGRGLESTIEEAIGAGSAVLVVSFSKGKGKEIGTADGS
jgi:hypothetical protein